MKYTVILKGEKNIIICNDIWKGGTVDALMTCKELPKKNYAIYNQSWTNDYGARDVLTGVGYDNTNYDLHTTVVYKDGKELLIALKQDPLKKVENYSPKYEKWFHNTTFNLLGLKELNMIEKLRVMRYFATLNIEPKLLNFEVIDEETYYYLNDLASNGEIYNHSLQDLMTKKEIITKKKN